MLRAVLLTALVGCARPLPSERAAASVAALPVTPATLPVAPPVEPPPIAEPPAADEPVEVEAAELEWDVSPLHADLDGDGAAESIGWSCGAGLRLTVGRARARAAYQVSELIGCAAAVLTLRPDQATRQVVVTVDEHDEAGPDLHFIYSYERSRLKLVWSGAAGVEFFADGAWVSETSDCDDVAGYESTVRTRHRWDGVRVAREVSEERTPVAPGGCADP
jgi:hypothetical protein